MFENHVSLKVRVIGVTDRVSYTIEVEPPENTNAELIFKITETLLRNIREIDIIGVGAVNGKMLIRASSTIDNFLKIIFERKFSELVKNIALIYETMVRGITVSAPVVLSGDEEEN